MHKNTAIIACLAAGLTLGVQGELVHRYDFSGHAVNDLIGTDHGTVSGNTAVFNAPITIADGSGPGAGTTLLISGAPETGDGGVNQISGLTLNALNNDLRADAGTLSLWFKPTAPSGQDYLISAGLGKGFSLLVDSTSTANAPVVKDDTVPSPGTAELAYGEGFGVGEWNHYAITWTKDVGDGTGTATVYLNESEFSYTFQSTNWIPGPLRIGNFNPADDRAERQDNQFNGSIYDLQIYDNQLSGTDIDALQDTPGSVIPEPVTIGLVGIFGGMMLFMKRLFT